MQGRSNLLTTNHVVGPIKLAIDDSESVPVFCMSKIGRALIKLCVF